MPDQLTSALLIVVAIAYLGGAVLLVVALAKVLLAWSVSWRASGQTSPVDVVLQQRAGRAWGLPQEGDPRRTARVYRPVAFGARRPGNPGPGFAGPRRTWQQRPGAGPAFS